MKYINTNLLEKLKPDEPYFFIRAQDFLAPEAVADYAHHLLKKFGDEKGYEQCLKISERMTQWQKDNPQHVKRPD